jgi:predicted RNA binding protein YcfA (HicA-like mRNA interferase family)
MKLPHDLSGAKRAKALGRVGYEVARRTGSHVRLTNDSQPQHDLTIPAHDPLKVGTLAAILGDVATHLNLKIDRDKLLRRLFD